MNRFIAAIDSSGGSTGGVLDRYCQKYTEEDKMDKIHAMRMRMLESSGFNNSNIWAAILYKGSIERGIVPVLESKNIDAFLKVDAGCNEDGTMKDFDLESEIEYANLHSCYGTKMRSIVKDINMVDTVVKQQFKLANQIAKADLVPIVEPEVPIDHPNKDEIEKHLKYSLLDHLDYFEEECILKLTPPEQPNLYWDLANEHTNVMKVVFLSGGYSTSEACNKLGLNDGVTASFSRALTEGLRFDMDDTTFNEQINKNIDLIFQSCN